MLLPSRQGFCHSETGGAGGLAIIFENGAQSFTTESRCSTVRRHCDCKLLGDSCNDLRSTEGIK